ncbi:MAG: DUF1559 domain-containing protein [Capsulimonadaceae bacterium]|nr:DUF1559 domain-containing protein [Capsulimonadaceae bacterium]
MKKMAFTLIELLIVIAIITILAAILFPVFATAREKARQSSCASNEKQLGTAFMQYVQDYDESFPNGLAGSSGYNGGGWAGQIYPYCKSVQLFTCPDDPFQATTSTTWGQRSAISYGYNVDLHQVSTDLSYQEASNAPGLIMGKLSAPAVTVVLFEIQQVNQGANLKAEALGQEECCFNNDSLNLSPTGNGGYQSIIAGWQGGADYATGPLGVYTSAAFPAYGATSAPTAWPNGGYWPGRHSGGSNWLLADGHVKWLLGANVSPGSDASRPTGITDAPRSPASQTTAAGTSNLGNGNSYAITYSPI